MVANDVTPAEIKLKSSKVYLPRFGKNLSKDFEVNNYADVSNVCTQIGLGHLNWARRRTFHERNSLSLVRLTKSWTFGLAPIPPNFGPGVFFCCFFFVVVVIFRGNGKKRTFSPCLPNWRGRRPPDGKLTRARSHRGIYHENRMIHTNTVSCYDG